jgi:hypothetical protein
MHACKKPWPPHLPIIATQVGGNAALLKNGRYGSLIPSEDVTSALAAELLKQYGLRAEGDHLAARASIIQRYGLDAVLARYAALFGVRNFSIRHNLLILFEGKDDSEALEDTHADPALPQPGIPGVRHFLYRARQGVGCPCGCPCDGAYTPYYPKWLPGKEDWKKWTRVERQGTVEGNIRVTYPRYASVPGTATWLQGVTMARSAHHDLESNYDGLAT